jgi:hypothetical protein
MMMNSILINYLRHLVPQELGVMIRVYQAGAWSKAVPLHEEIPFDERNSTIMVQLLYQKDDKSYMIMEMKSIHAHELCELFEQLKGGTTVE